MTPERRQAAIESQSQLRPTGTYPAGIPTTIADVNGKFTIPDLPPGTYIITAGLVGARGGWSIEGSVQPVEVKEGAETILPKPIKLLSGL
jgi:hypothetical protein